MHDGIEQNRNKRLNWQSQRISIQLDTMGRELNLMPIQMVHHRTANKWMSPIPTNYTLSEIPIIFSVYVFYQLVCVVNSE